MSAVSAATINAAHGQAVNGAKQWKDHVDEAHVLDP
jgi:hypothetical protein